MTAPRVPLGVLDELEAALAKATPGVWKLWGMSVMADQDGTSNVDTAVGVAHTAYRDEHGKPRTFEAQLICDMHAALPGLLAALRQHQAAVRAVEALTYASDDRTEYKHHHPIGDGEPECPACWVDGIRAALAPLSGPRGLTVAEVACPTCAGPSRETVGMVCQTCGTDYAAPVDRDREELAGALNSLGWELDPKAPSNLALDALAPVVARRAAEAARDALMWAAETVAHAPGIKHQAKAVTEILARAAALDTEGINHD